MKKLSSRLRQWWYEYMYPIKCVFQGLQQRNYALYYLPYWLKALFFTFLHWENKKITSWTTHHPISGKFIFSNSVCIWQSAQYPINYDPPDPAHDELQVGNKWYIFGYNIEQVY